MLFCVFNGYSQGFGVHTAAANFHRGLNQRSTVHLDRLWFLQWHWCGLRSMTFPFLFSIFKNVLFPVFYTILIDNICKENMNYHWFILFPDMACLKYNNLKTILWNSMISIPSVISSPQVSSPSCPGLSAEIPHRYPPCFSKRLSSGTFLGADTKPTIEKKTSS